MSVMLSIPTICLPSKTGTRDTPDFFITLVQYLMARPGDTVTNGLLMIWKTLVWERFFLFGPASITLVTTSALVMMPYASFLFLRSTIKLETFCSFILRKASATVALLEIVSTPLRMISAAVVSLTLGIRHLFFSYKPWLYESKATIPNTPMLLPSFHQFLI